MSDKKIKVFVSYFEDDARPTARHIQGYFGRRAFPSGQRFDVYVAHRNLPYGAKIERENMESLCSSNVVLVLVTPGAYSSKPMAREVTEAKRKLRRKRLTIVPCKDEHLGISWPQMPWDLGNILGVDMPDSDELFCRRLYEAFTRTSGISAIVDGMSP